MRLNTKSIGRILSHYMLYFGLIQIIPLMLCLYDEHHHHHNHTHAASGAFILSIGVCIVISLFLRYLSRDSKKTFYRREAIVLALTIWVITPLIGIIPIYISNSVNTITDAFFESVSGFTTTGASIIDTESSTVHTVTPLDDIITGERYYGLDTWSRGLLFWRSFSQWLGGVGIVILFLSFLPLSGTGTKLLLQNEITGPSKETFTEKSSQTAKSLGYIYLSLTGLLWFILTVSGHMNWFEALTTTFSTVSTGGFSIYSDSIAHYNSSFVNITLIIFMIIGGTNFTIFHGIYRRAWHHLNQYELKWYLIIMMSAVIIISLQLMVSNTDLIDIIFQTVSVQTSSGFTTTNFAAWPTFSRFVLFLLMYIGSMSGSTGAGLKVMRLYLMFSYGIHKIKRLANPSRIIPYQINRRQVDTSILSLIFVYFSLVMLVSVISMGVYISFGYDDIESACGLTNCMINNIGVTFGVHNPDVGFCMMPPLAKCYSCMLMILGRLELFTVLVFFHPNTWK